MDDQYKLGFITIGIIAILVLLAVSWIRNSNKPRETDWDKVHIACPPAPPELTWEQRKQHVMTDLHLKIGGINMLIRKAQVLEYPKRIIDRLIIIRNSMQEVLDVDLAMLKEPENLNLGHSITYKMATEVKDGDTLESLTKRIFKEPNKNKETSTDKDPQGLISQNQRKVPQTIYDRNDKGQSIMDILKDNYPKNFPKS